MNKLDYRTLYFDIQRPELDITKPQTTVGITLKVGEDFLVWAHTTGDLGGEPEALDATPLSALVQMNKTGIQALDNWTVDYYFNDEDYMKLEEIRKSGELYDITVTMPHGGQFTNKGKCTANYATGMSVNSMAEGHAVFELSSAEGWGYTPATTESVQTYNATRAAATKAASTKTV